MENPAATIENGSDALRIALKSHPALVLLDAMMPGMDGYAVAAEMQSLSDLQATPSTSCESPCANKACRARRTRHR